MIKHLKEQLSKSQTDAEQLSILKIQQASLENQIDKLKQELKEARKFHTPVSIVRLTWIMFWKKCLKTPKG
jgi:hypothetical protein